jgi:phosphoglycerate dehydrogenase-like enzyme
MKNILVVMPLDQEQRAALEQSAPGWEITYSSYEGVTREQAAGAEVILGNIPCKWLKNCENLRLLQLNSAGANPYADEGVLPAGVQLCCASGAYGLSLAEYMVGEILAVKRRIHQYHGNQLGRIWRNEGKVTSIYGSTTLIWGLGDIGREFALRMRAMGSYLIGVRRTEGPKPDYVDEVYTAKEIDQILGRADTVAMCLPGTPETRHIVNKERLLKMKPDALLMNVGRGNAIDPQALIEVLQQGHLGSVVLDVTEPEPLPEDSPLWGMERVHITPHIAGLFNLRETVNRIVALAGRNIRNLEGGAPLESQVDLKTGYRRS